MIRVTFGVNVIVSSLLNLQSTLGRLVESIPDARFKLIISDHILDRVHDVCRRPCFQTRVTPRALANVTDGLRTYGMVVKPAMDVRGVAEDEDDDFVLATAVAGRADYLATGDKGLLALREFRGVAIITPRTFLDLLLREDMELE